MKRIARTFVRPMRGIVSLLGAVCATAQTPVTDPASFRRPLIFAAPEVPESILANRSDVTYAIDLSIATDGTVSEVSRLEPDHADFRAQLAKLTKFWLFFPSLDPETCQPVPSTARVHVEFKSSEGRGTRTWLQYDPMMRLLSGERPVVLKKMDPPRYPWRELRDHKTGKVYTVSVVDQDGKVTRTWTLLEDAHSPGFVSTAQAHAATVTYNTSRRETRCTVTEYRFRLQ